MTTAFYLIIVLLVPGATPKAEDAQLDVSTTLVRQCPDKDAFKATLDDEVKAGKIIRYDVSCVHAIVNEGQPA